MSRAAMQQALAYIEEVDYGPYDKWPVILALKQALAEPEQKPVAWMDREGDVYKELPSPFWCPPHTPLYAHPPTPRKPLTEDQIVDIWAGVSMGYDDEINIIELARALERAHGITGDGDE